MHHFLGYGLLSGFMASQELVAAIVVSFFRLVVGLGTGRTRGGARRVLSLAVSAVRFTLVGRIESSLEG